MTRTPVRCCDALQWSYCLWKYECTSSPHKASRASQVQEESLETQTGMALCRHKQVLLISPYGFGNHGTKGGNANSFFLFLGWDTQNLNLPLFPKELVCHALSLHAQQEWSWQKPQVWPQHPEKPTLREMINVLSTHSRYRRMNFIIHKIHKAQRKAWTFSHPACFIMLTRMALEATVKSLVLLMHYPECTAT